MWIVIFAATLPIIVGLIGLKMQLGRVDSDNAPPFIGL